ncbi:MAG: hypothetical protein IPH57_02390 [Saprospiraceae bacterium]|nr:hypothetical protein [Saprospiraceae bacterium]
MKNLIINSKTFLQTGLFLFFSLIAYFASAQISSTTITVQSKSVAATGTSTTDADICNGQSTSITVVGGSLGTGATWKWYEDVCGTGTSIGNTPTITVTPPNTTSATITKTYYVRAEGICNTTACQPIEITIFPTPVVTAPANAIYCVGATVPAKALTGTPILVITYDISGGAEVGLADATGQSEIPAFTATNATNASITRTITITPKANGCTGNPVTFTITVTPDVTITQITNQIVCNGTSTTAVTVTSNVQTGEVVYNWTNDNTGIGLAASGTGIIQAFNGVNATCGNIVATITVTPVFTEGSSNCTEGTATFTITVRPTPNGTIAATTPICEGVQAQLTFTRTCGTGPFTLDIKQDGGSPNAGYPGITSGTAFNVEPNPTFPGVHTYDLMKITDANGCIKE